MQIQQCLFDDWQNANVIWIDQPVGTGYSYADSIFDYVVNEKQIAQDMYVLHSMGPNSCSCRYVFLQEFLRIYPQYQHLDFFVTGESYAGHYVPAVANRIVQVRR